MSPDLSFPLDWQGSIVVQGAAERLIGVLNKTRTVLDRHSARMRSMYVM